MIHAPTKRQQALLKFIADFSDEHGVSPTYREIAGALGLSSVSAVAEHVENCVAAGLLTKHPREARSLQVVTDTQTYSDVAKLFRKKIAELNQLAAGGADGAVVTYEKQISILKRAASILGVKL